MHHRQQNQFCRKGAIDTIQIDELKVIEFLRGEYCRGFFFSYLCSYVSALRNYLSNSTLDANNIKRSKKKLFKLRPT